MMSSGDGAGRAARSYSSAGQRGMLSGGDQVYAAEPVIEHLARPVGWEI